MALEPEAVGSHGPEVSGAPVHLVHAVAAPAMEVVVMTLPGDLVARGFAREIHGDDPSVVLKTLEIAVDRRDPETTHMGAGGVEELFGAERMPGLLEGFSNRASLTRFSLDQRKGTQYRKKDRESCCLGYYGPGRDSTARDTVRVASACEPEEAGGGGE